MSYQRLKHTHTHTHTQRRQVGSVSVWEEPLISLVFTKQSGSAQFRSLHMGTVIFMFPAKVVDGRKNNRPVLFFVTPLLTFLAH